MSPKATVPPADRTPLAKLSEAAVHPIVGYQLAQAGIVTDQVFDERVGHRGGLRRVEFTILALVKGNPDVTARQLARALAVTPPNIAIWLDKLEARGLVARQRSTTDARVHHIRITPAGATLVDSSVQQLLQGEEAALSSLTPAERAMLVELLHKVALSRKRGEPKGG
jgi:DNA-binding MarR family transcriptional regulator